MNESRVTQQLARESTWAQDYFGPLVTPKHFFARQGQPYWRYFFAQFFLALIFSTATYSMQVELFRQASNNQKVEVFQALYWVSAVCSPLIIPWLCTMIGRGLCWLLGLSIAPQSVTLVVMVGEYAYRVVMLASLALMLPLQVLENPVSLVFLAKLAGLGPTTFGYALAAKLHLAFVWEVILVAFGIRLQSGTTYGRALFIAVFSIGIFTILHLLFLSFV
ncbi:MAG: hypothetical protein Q8O51_02940 [bacterium]|nr:hypothetical protein [bacterium]